jgi:hypothetical protein
MSGQLRSVVVVLALLAGVIVLPAGAGASGSGSGSGLVVEWDASVPVGAEAFVRGVAPAGALGVRTEVLDAGEWVESEVGVIGADGGFELSLSFAADVVGASTYRVVVGTADGEVSSDEFVVTRTPLPDEPVSDEPVSDEPVSEEPMCRRSRCRTSRWMFWRWRSIR